MLFKCGQFSFTNLQAQFQFQIKKMSPRSTKNDCATENKSKNNVLKVKKQTLGTKKFVTREVLRKNLRKLKKQKKNKKQTFPGTHDISIDSHDGNDTFKEVEKLPCQTQLPKKSKAIKEKNAESSKKKETFDQQSMKQRTKQLQIANKLEEKNIKKIEKQLKLNKRKSKGVPKSFVDDGLDFLLEVCDPDYRSKLTKEEFDFADNDAGFEEDLALLNSKSDVKNKKEKNPKEVKVKKILSKGTNDTSLRKDISNSEDSDSSCDMNEDHAESIASENDSLSENEGIQENSCTGIRTSKDEKMEIYQEDIYGRLRDKKGNLITEQTVEQVKYVPPGKRLATSDEFDADIQKLKRQMKGLFNRLAETNLPSIVSAIEKLYLSHSRHNMQEAIHTLVMDSLVCEVLSPERLIMEHCVLIAALHANVGTEVGAQFLELVVRKFDASYKTESQTKELDNMILILCHMYNFGLVAAPLLKDILHMLAEKFEEKDIELILIVLRTVGFALRKDDPVSLKEIIFVLQTKAGQATEQPARIRFMLEILLAIRNNNMTKIPNYDPSHTEHLRKLLRSLTKKGDALSKLNITYSELLAANNRGRWWIVGSAWVGQGPTATTSQAKQVSSNSDEPEYSVELLEMARKQRMNTEVRRNIFCILMTAEDFVEAFERLMRLGLKSQQEREIVHVIMDCCLQEKSFNPYYAHLLQKLCNFHRRFQIASQFALWDHFKDLSSQSQLQISHLSKLIVHLTVEGSLSISVLKVIQFSEMDRLLVRFLRQILLGLLLNPSENAVKSVFASIGSSKYGLLREGLLLFMHHFLMKNMEKMDESDAEKLRSRIQMVQENFL